MTKKTEKKYIYKGSFIKISEYTDFSVNNIYKHEIIEESEGVLIAAVTKERKIVIIPQYRILYGKTYEVPAGAIKPHESSIQAAKRELLEETGITAASWELLSEHTNSVHSIGKNYYYLATELNFINVTKF